MSSLIERKFTTDKFDRKKEAFFDNFGWESMPFAQKDPLRTPNFSSRTRPKRSRNS